MVFLCSHECQPLRGIADRFKIRRSKTIHETRDESEFQSGFQPDRTQVLEEQLVTSIFPRKANFDFLREPAASQNTRINAFRAIRGAYKEDTVLSLQAADFYKELIHHLNVVLT